MTVAAVILLPTVEGALADVAGRPAVRRMVETAWAGGATPIVVVAPDMDGRVAAALAGSPSILAEPAPGATGTVGQVVRGVRLAAERVSETEAALIWPGRMVWVDAETITSLIEAHGADRQALLRPTYHSDPGWPVLLPIQLEPTLAALSPESTLDELLDELTAGAGADRPIDTGDPGVTHDRRTVIDELPGFEGPPEPVAGPPPEWGSEAAESSDDGPLQGPALAPYGQAAEEEL